MKDQNNKERKKQKVISPNHWMFKLHEFCWGHRPKYIGYCPLWWNTWINLGILPIAVIFHFLRVMVSWTKYLWPEKVVVEDTPTRKLFPAKQPPDHELVRIYERTPEGRDPINYSTDIRTDIWLAENPHWRSFYAAAKQRMIDRERLRRIKDEEDRLRAITTAARKAKLEEKQAIVINWLKYLVKPALIASACAAVWLTYKILGWFISVFSWSMAFMVAKNIGILAIIVGVCYLIVISVSRFIDFMASLDNKRCAAVREPGIISKFFSKIGGFIATVFGAFGEGFDFIKNTIDIVYHKNCPLIVLSEDGTTRPIEKITTSEDS